VAEFKKANDHVEADAGETDTTRATARLPGLDIEITHRRAVEDDAEQISINLRARPSFEAVGRVVQAANPFAFWAQGAQLAWMFWLEATRPLALPRVPAPSLPRPGSDVASRPKREGSSSE
jgi:hypothetical protein